MVLGKVQVFPHMYMLLCLSECTRAEACARTCVGRALEQFTTAGLLMNEGIRRADVGHEARK